MTKPQDLCLSCGLCCQGAMHPRVPLEESEVSRLGELLPGAVFRIQGQAKLKLPCQALKNKSCTIYNERPKRCRAYECKLLKKLRAGEIPYEAAAAIVEQAHSNLGDREFLSEHFDEKATDSRETA